jgi:acyl dehydratase
MFGGLIASGWHTCAIMMRMTADTIRPQSAGDDGLARSRFVSVAQAGAPGRHAHRA